MKRNKWQGMACLLLVSLMANSLCAAPIRNENPKSQAPATMPSAPGTPVPTTPPNTSTQSQATNKSNNLQPGENKPNCPTPTTKPNELMSGMNKPNCPMPTAKPNESTPGMNKPICPTPTAKPNESTSGMNKSTCPTNKPSKLEKPCHPNPQTKCGQKTTAQTTTQKPFMLDHFKMIVNTLKKLGVEESQIITYIKEGKKLEDILTAEKIKPKKFKKCMYKEYCRAVDGARKNGKITSEQAKQLKTAIKETIKNWLPAK